MILEIVLVTAAAEILLVAVMIVALFAHAFVLGVRQRQQALRYPRARQILYEYISDPLRALGADEEAFLKGLRWSEQVELLAGLARALAVDERPALFELSRILGLTELANRRARSRWWRRRLRAVRLLTVLSDDRSLVPKLVTDPNPEVRADAVEWAADEPTAEMAALIVPLLENASPRYRFAVIDALIRMRGAGVETLQTLLRSSTDAATLTAALKVARHIADPRLLAVAMSLTGNVNADVVAGAALVLGSIGGADSPKRLRELLGHDSDLVRAAAIRALRDLDDRDALEEIASRLRDKSWNVRWEAALTLRAFGDDGTLLLRQLTGVADAFAADMARQILSLPAGTTP